MKKRCKPCVHCERRRGDRPRGLCWKCYRTPAIRAATPCVEEFEHKGGVIKLRHGVLQPEHARPAAEPTDALPRSGEKLAVLAMRAQRGEELWHPQDGRVAA